jgi:hypothetical protein
MMIDFSRLGDDDIISKAQLAVWRGVSVDAVEAEVRAGKLRKIQLSARRVGFRVGDVRESHRAELAP